MPNNSGVKKTKSSNFVINLDKIPNGRRKPVELCEFLEKLRRWREASRRSQIVFD